MIDFLGLPTAYGTLFIDVSSVIAIEPSGPHNKCIIHYGEELRFTCLCSSVEAEARIRAHSIEMKKRRVDEYLREVTKAEPEEGS